MVVESEAEGVARSVDLSRGSIVVGRGWAQIFEVPFSLGAVDQELSTAGARGCRSLERLDRNFAGSPKRLVLDAPLPRPDQTFEAVQSAHPRKRPVRLARWRRFAATPGQQQALRWKWELPFEFPGRRREDSAPPWDFQRRLSASPPRYRASDPRLRSARRDAFAPFPRSERRWCANVSSCPARRGRAAIPGSLLVLPPTHGRVR